MPWSFKWPLLQPQHSCVLGLDVGPDACRWVILSGGIAQPEVVCCAEYLTLPEALMAHGDVLEPEALGRYLQQQLAMSDYHPAKAYIGLDDTCLSHHLVMLVAGLSPEDVAFQLSLEMQDIGPDVVCIDYTLAEEAAPDGEQLYRVQVASRSRVEGWQRVMAHAGLSSVVFESRQMAAQRALQSPARALLPQASVALALQCSEAFGLALRAWTDETHGLMSPHQGQHDALRRAWWQGVVVCAVGGVFLALGFAMVMASAADHRRPQAVDMDASARALAAVQQQHAQAKAQHDRQVEQARWLQAQQALQAQSLHWSRVLGQAPQGVWVAHVKQQGARWTVHGEALSSAHAQQLAKQLQMLPIWAKAPEVPELQIKPATSETGLPVWKFRIEADLKVGV